MNQQDSLCVVRFNTSFAYGGVQLTLFTFPSFSYNHQESGLTEMVKNPHQKPENACPELQNIPNLGKFILFYR